LTDKNEKKDPPEALPTEFTPQAILNWIVQNWWLVLIIILLIIIIILIVVRTRHSPKRRVPRYIYYY
jgi:type II secretory pathway component PulF